MKTLKLLMFLIVTFTLGFALIATPQEEFDTACKSGDLNKLDQILNYSFNNNISLDLNVIGSWDTRVKTVDLLRLWVKNRGNLNEFKKHSSHFTFFNKDIDSIVFLIDNNINSEFLEELLLNATDFRWLEGIVLLLDRGANPDKALMSAAGTSYCQSNYPSMVNQSAENDYSIVKILLDRGAKVDQLNKDYEVCSPALGEACYKGHVDTVKLLLEKNAEVNGLYYKLHTPGTPLLLACKANNIEIVKLLISKGANVNYSRADIWELRDTPLIIAAAKGNKEIVKILIKNGADVNYVSKWHDDQHTALYKAVENNHVEIAKILLEHKANVNSISRCNSVLAPYTPLMLAAKKSNPAMVRLLIEHGANIYAENEDNETALTLAVNRKKEHPDWRYDIKLLDYNSLEVINILKFEYLIQNNKEKFFKDLSKESLIWTIKRALNNLEIKNELPDIGKQVVDIYLKLKDGDLTKLEELEMLNILRNKSTLSKVLKVKDQKVAYKLLVDSISKILALSKLNIPFSLAYQIVLEY